MWYGLTQSPGWRQSGDFSSLSPSVLSSGTALNRMTWTRSNRQTWRNKFKDKCKISYPTRQVYWLSYLLYLLYLLSWKVQKVSPQKSFKLDAAVVNNKHSPCQLVWDNQSSSFCPFGLDWRGRTLPASFLWWTGRSLRDTLERCPSAICPTIARPTSALPQVSLPKRRKNRVKYNVTPKMIPQCFFNNTVCQLIFKRVFSI